MDLFFSQDLNKAARHFARAAELDSTFVTARFWQAYALQRRRKEMDSLITAISPLQDRLPPVERAGLEAFIAETRGDWQSAYRAHKRAAQLAPQSNWAYMAAYSALQLDRPREALELLADLDPTRGWLKEFLGYWQVQLMALHRLGEYGKQLAVAQSLLKLFVDRPTSGWRVDIQPLIAMAALGSHRDLKESVDSLEREAPAKGISAGAYSLWAAEELRAHGYLEEAARHFVRCVELQRQNDYCLLSAGRYAEVYAKLKPLADSAQCTAQDCPAWPLLGRFAVAAAHLGRSEEAQTTVERIQETAAGWQAQAARVRIAALLGQTDRASELLRDLIRQENFRSDIWSWLHFMLNSDLVSLREHWRADPIVGPIVRIGDQKTAARRAK
jgi:tetratricopeptide (TPR) repeat protein